MARLTTTVLTIHLFFLSGCAGREDTSQSRETAQADAIAVHVDPTVELVATIYRLADVHPFNTQLLPSYIRDVEEHFGPFRDHPTVRVVQELGRNQGITGSAPMALAVYLTWPNLEGKVPLSTLPPDLDPRWTPETVATFREAVRTFAEDTRFMEFFAEHGDYYRRSEESLLNSLEGHSLIAWLQDYFGEDSDHYILIVGMQIGNGNYGLSTTLQDGSREFISVVGANSPSLFRKTPTFSDWWFIPTVVHEFAHSFVNPVVHSNGAVLQDVGERLYPHLREELWPLGYRSWQTLCDEYLVRATVNRYLENRGEREKLRRRIEADLDQGFAGITRFSDALAEYEANRELYPDLDSFLPRVVQCFEEILREMEG